MDDPVNRTLSITYQLHIRRTKYSSTLVLCFIISLGLCCALLSNLPSIHCSGCGDDSRVKDITYAIIRCAISIVLLFFGIYAVWIVRNRSKFHKNREVYWPFGCSHCALAVGRVSNTSGRESDTSGTGLSTSSDLPEDQEDTSSDTSIIASRSNEHNDEESGPCCLHSVEASYNNTAVEMESPNSRIVESVHKKPHKSLIMICNVFGVLCLINLPIRPLAVITCLALSDNSISGNVALISELMLEISMFITIVASLFFFNIYYEAVFIDVAKFSYAFALFFGTGLWMMSLNISFPIGKMLDAFYDPLEYHCDIGDTFKKLTLDHDDRITSFYAECCLVFAATVWQMWSAILPPPSLYGRGTTSHVMSHVSLFRKIKLCVKNLHRKITLCGDGNTDERQDILLNQGITRKNKPHGRARLLILFIFSILYCAGHFTLYWDSFNLSAYTLTYSRWSLEIAYSLPLFGLLHYESFIVNRPKRILIKPSIFARHGRLEGHDRLLLLGSWGIFVISMLRLIGAIKMLCGLISVRREDIVLASYAAIYSIFRVYLFWSMTSFLLVVQRRTVQSLTEAKLVTSCLLYMIALNATNWLISIAEENSWIELQSYYGSKVGEVMGGLFEPFESLYGLHAAIVAYETYQKLLSRC